ncbi:MAG: hypothetical protein KDC39_07420 [Actinobacteria bacterium]|nr:hypothetical protein [Actinomycetota bacterium]
MGSGPVVPSPDNWADDMRAFVAAIPDAAYLTDAELSPIITAAARCILESATQLEVVKSRLERLERLIRKHHYPTRPVDHGDNWHGRPEDVSEYGEKPFCYVCATPWPCEYVLAAGYGGPGPSRPEPGLPRTRDGHRQEARQQEDA